MTFHELTLLNAASDTSSSRSIYGVYGCVTWSTYWMHVLMDSIFEVSYADQF